MTQWKICIELAEINSVTQPPLPLHNKIQTVIPTNIFINYIEKYKLIFFKKLFCFNSIYFETKIVSSSGLDTGTNLQFK